MSVETEVVNLRARVIKLEHLVEFLYQKLNIDYVEDINTADDPNVVEMIRRGNKIEAIKIYRGIHNVGLAEAKNAVEEMQTRLGL